MPPFCNDCGGDVYKMIDGHYSRDYHHKCKVSDIKNKLYREWLAKKQFVTKES